jgi:hypothetical protein
MQNYGKRRRPAIIRIDSDGAAEDVDKLALKTIAEQERSGRIRKTKAHRQARLSRQQTNSQYTA